MSKPMHPHSIELLDNLHRAPKLLNNNASDQITNFITSQLTGEGGFANRAGECDLYYTMFGLGCALSLKILLPRQQISRYLQQHSPATLDLVHLVCWIKSQSMLKLLRYQTYYPLIRSLFRYQLYYRPKKIDLAKFRVADDGFTGKGTVGTTNPYSIFMSLNLYQDCGHKITNIPHIIKALEICRTSNGAFHNPDGGEQEMLSSTSAAILALRQLTGKVDIQPLDWLAGQQGKTGGWHASPDTQMPDLLSTAVALFTLRICGYPLDKQTSSARAFILDHWHENGGFTGTLVDDCADCEYTFYALMALGALAS